MRLFVLRGVKFSVNKLLYWLAVLEFYFFVFSEAIRIILSDVFCFDSANDIN